MLTPDRMFEPPPARPPGFEETLRPVKKKNKIQTREASSAVHLFHFTRLALTTQSFLVLRTCTYLDQVSIQCLKGGQQ